MTASPSLPRLEKARGNSAIRGRQNRSAPQTMKKQLMMIATVGATLVLASVAWAQESGSDNAGSAGSSGTHHHHHHGSGSSSGSGASQN